MTQHPNKLGYFTKSYDLPSAVSTFRREEMILDSMGFFLKYMFSEPHYFIEHF